MESKTVEELSVPLCQRGTFSRLYRFCRKFLVQRYTDIAKQIVEQYATTAVPRVNLLLSSKSHYKLYLILTDEDSNELDELDEAIREDYGLPLSSLLNNHQIGLAPLFYVATGICYYLCKTYHVDGDTLKHNDLACNICLDDFTLSQISQKKYVMTNSCGHYFHYSCLRPWIKQTSPYPTCPTCRTSISLYCRPLEYLTPKRLFAEGCHYCMLINYGVKSSKLESYFKFYKPELERESPLTIFLEGVQWVNLEDFPKWKSRAEKVFKEVHIDAFHPREPRFPLTLLS